MLQTLRYGDTSALHRLTQSHLFLARKWERHGRSQRDQKHKKGLRVLLAGGLKTEGATWQATHAEGYEKLRRVWLLADSQQGNGDSVPQKELGKKERNSANHQEGVSISESPDQISGHP